MPKRKREVEGGDPPPPPTEGTDNNTNNNDDNRALRIRTSRLTTKFAQGNLQLHRALKLARGFERQKLGRRQKVAMRESPQELLRLKEEVVVLKGLDLGKVAERYLWRRCGRVKGVREAVGGLGMGGGGVFAGEGEEGRDGRDGGWKVGAEANVVARLINSNPVREVMPGIMAGVCRCLGLEEFPSVVGKGTGTRERNEASTLDGSARKSVNGDGGDESIDLGRNACSQTGEDRKPDEATDDAANRSMAHDDGFVTATTGSEESATDEEMAQFDNRLASSSSGSEFAFASDTEGAGEPSSRTRLLKANSRPQPIKNPSLSPPLSPSPPPQPTIPTSKHPCLKPPSNTNTTTNTSSTTFLPSLTLGGYFSGSDSDSASDLDSTSKEGPALPPQRKNRRGQRARQQIAEKKYGRGARHLVKQRQGQVTTKGRIVEGKGRDDGWDLRKGATTMSTSTPTDARGKGKGNRWADRRTGGSGPAKATGANEEVLKARRQRGAGPGKADDKTGPIHPSWEAARKRKQEQQQLQRSSLTAGGGGGGGGVFQGKKVVFD